MESFVEEKFTEKLLPPEIQKAEKLLDKQLMPVFFKTYKKTRPKK